MSSVWHRYGAVIAVTVVVGIPLGVLVMILLARSRIRHGWDRSWAWRASAAEVGMVVLTLPWLWMIMTPTSGANAVQLVPFRDLRAVLDGSDTTVQVVGNLLVFAGLGFCLPIRFRLGGVRATPWVTASIAAGLSVCCEVLQHTLRIGRVASIDDVLINAFGALLACLAGYPWWRSRAEIRASAR